MPMLEQTADVDGTTTSVVANQFVTFNSGERAFGIDIMNVREIRGWSPVTELPSQPAAAVGVLDIRGKIVQVYDLQRILGGYGTDGGAGRVVLVVSLKNQDVGLLVDSVSDIVFVQPEDLRPLPGRVVAQSDGIVSFMVKIEQRLISMLNLSALFPAEANAFH